MTLQWGGGGSLVLVQRSPDAYTEEDGIVIYTDETNIANYTTEGPDV